MPTFLLIMQLFPLVLNAVKAVEQSIPLPGQGQKKLDLVLNVLKQAYDASTELSAHFSWDKLVAVVTPMITQIVSLHNDLGVFVKPKPAAKPAK